MRQGRPVWAVGRCSASARSEFGNWFRGADLRAIAAALQVRKIHVARCTASGIVEHRKIQRSNNRQSDADKEEMNVTDPTNPGFQNSPQQLNSPPPKQGSSAVKIILIVVAIVVCLGIAVVGVVGYGFYRVSKAVHKDLTTGKVTIDTPNGTISAMNDAKLTEADLGIAIYPGAEQTKGSARLNLGNGPMVTANFLTSDPKEKVIAFYKDQLGSGAENMVSGNGAFLMVTKANKESINITISQSPSLFDGKTRITILHATPNSK